MPNTEQVRQGVRAEEHRVDDDLDGGNFPSMESVRLFINEVDDTIAESRMGGALFESLCVDLRFFLSETLGETRRRFSCRRECVSQSRSLVGEIRLLLVALNITADEKPEEPAPQQAQTVEELGRRESEEQLDGQVRTITRGLNRYSEPPTLEVLEVPGSPDHATNEWLMHLGLPENNFFDTHEGEFHSQRHVEQTVGYRSDLIEEGPENASYGLGFTDARCSEESSPNGVVHAAREQFPKVLDQVEKDVNGTPAENLNPNTTPKFGLDEKSVTQEPPKTSVDAESHEKGNITLARRKIVDAPKRKKPVTNLKVKSVVTTRISKAKSVPVTALQIRGKRDHTNLSKHTTTIPPQSSSTGKPIQLKPKKGAVSFLPPSIQKDKSQKQADIKKAMFLKKGGGCTQPDSIVKSIANTSTRRLKQGPAGASKKNVKPAFITGAKSNPGFATKVNTYRRRQ
ncbi:hypothetical protein BSKO_12886 [Bryopsis sp. KO-2023]|nr:hypothetical protein BSKO_12886 [Bryopsis sp. KO-2023]